MGKDFKHFLVLNAQVSHGDTRGGVYGQDRERLLVVSSGLE